MNTDHIVVIGCGFVLVLALIAVGLTLPMYFIWNCALIDAVPAAHLAHISLGQAFGISCLLGMVGKSPAVASKSRD